MTLDRLSDVRGFLERLSEEPAIGVAFVLQPRDEAPFGVRVRLPGGLQHGDREANGSRAEANQEGDSDGQPDFHHYPLGRC